MIAIILAGGSGTRFWPLSRQALPKQLLQLWGDGPMIAQTIARLDGLVPLARTYIVVGEHLLKATQSALPGLARTSFVVEPQARNTAPAIGLAAIVAQREHGDEVVTVLPSDHFIRDIAAFQACLEVAREQALAGAIATMGIVPTRPETGFGYIRFDAHAPAPTTSSAHPKAFAARQFVEKPDLATAKGYLESGDYVWNAGMFVFRPSVLLAELERQQPAMHAALMRISEALGTPREAETTAREFAAMPSTSIDYAVMEGARNIVVIPASFDWSDVGHWGALDEIATPDAHGNVRVGEPVLEGCQDCVVFASAPGRVVAVGHVEGLVVVDTPDALLVLPKARAQDVRALVDQIRLGKGTQFL